MDRPCCSQCPHIELLISNGLENYSELRKVKADNEGQAVEFIKFFKQIKSEPKYRTVGKTAGQ